MQITPNTEPKQENYYEFKDIYIIPSKGCEVHEPYIDFESGLLIIDEADNYRVGGTCAFTTIPTIEHKLDPKTYKILTFEEWSQYFNYDKQEIISDDGKYKLITQRVYKKERDSDSIEEKLIDLETHEVISSCSRVAFHERKLENLLERNYREQREIEEYKRHIDALPTLDEFLVQELAQLQDDTPVLDYYNDKAIFRLMYQNKSFYLFKSQQQYNRNIDINTLQYQKIEQYETIHQFAKQYLTEKQWFLDHEPIYKNRHKLLKKFVDDFLNSLRYSHDFTYVEYEKIRTWENFYYESDIVKFSEYKQYCFLCKASIPLNSRYPKKICEECYEKPKFDENGLELSFYNLSMAGGFKIVYQKDGKTVKEETNKSYKRCFIDGKELFAEEHRFGGIVIQAESWQSQ